MVLQRLLAASAWCALAFAGAYLIDPTAFGFVRLPAAIVGAMPGDERQFLGLVASAAAAVVAVMVVSDMNRSDRPVTAPVVAGDDLFAPPPMPAAATWEATPSDRARLLDLARGARQAATAQRPADALSLSKTALVLARDLYAADPHGRAASDLAEILAQAAELEEAAGRLDTAQAAYEESLSLHRAVAGPACETPKAALALVVALCRLADCGEARGQRDRSCERYAEAIGIAERLAWLNPGKNVYGDILRSARGRLEALDPTRLDRPASLG